MELSAVMKTMLSSDSVKNLSKKTGSSQKEVTSVLTAALPLLLAGAESQAKDESTAEEFDKALEQHAEDDTTDLSGFLGKVDMADGAKILGHLLGDTKSTTKKVAKESETSDDNTAQILAAAAPLLMSLLGQETKKSKKNSKKGSKNATNEMVGDLVTAVLDNVDVGGLLMGMLSTQPEEETEETKTKKKTTTKKSTTAKKSTAKKSTAKKSTAKTTAKKSTAKTTAKKSTTKKSAAKKSTAKKKAADDGIDLGDVATLLTKVLK